VVKAPERLAIGLEGNTLVALHGDALVRNAMGHR
jgi:hypothetical protein